MILRPIAHMRSDFPEKFGIPRQGSLAQLRGAIVFAPEFRNPDALRGLELSSHIWLIWGFSEHVQESFSPTVRPPHLGGNVRMGVFATRSPFRPNGLGLSCVALDRIELEGEDGPRLHVLGVDLLDGTPIYDIKPYLPYADAPPEAASSFDAPRQTLMVEFPAALADTLDGDTLSQLHTLLALDPRPPYQQDAERVYGLRFRDLEVKFSVEGETLRVLSAAPWEDGPRKV